LAARQALFFQISSHKFGLNFAGEIKRQFFAKCCARAGVFLLGKLSLVKSNPGGT